MIHDKGVKYLIKFDASRFLALLFSSIKCASSGIIFCAVNLLVLIQVVYKFINILAINVDEKVAGLWGVCLACSLSILDDVSVFFGIQVNQPMEWEFVEMSLACKP